MEEGIIKITPDKEKAQSLLDMAESRLDMLDEVDSSKFASIIVEGYYEVLKEMMSAILLLDGYKTQGEGAHKKLIDFFGKTYKQFDEYEITLIDELRITRNKIAYDGFFVLEDYLERRKEDILAVISKLQIFITKKLSHQQGYE